MRKSYLRHGHEPHETQLNKNAGFSLVELLIAVVVLAIIVVPFARSFISSSRMNGNSRRLQRATTVAQDIVEGLKAYNIEELQEQFNNAPDGFYVIDSRLIHGRIEEDTAREALEATDGIYYFKMEDVMIQNVEYDALIKVDASVYDRDNVDPDDPDKHDNAFNVSDMARPGSVIKNRDGSYAQSWDLTRTVLNEIKNDSDFGLGDPGALTLPEDEEFSFKIFKNMGGKIERSIEVEISRDRTELDEDGNTVVYCKAIITFVYKCTYKGTTKTFVALDHVPCAADITSGNFYLFYYPLYEAEADNITIINDSKEPFQIFIVKQVELDSAGDQKLSDAQLDIAEKHYKAVVNIKDTQTNDIDNTVIRTNLGMNLVNSAFKGTLGRPSGDQMPTYEVEKEDSSIYANVTYKFNDAVSNNVNVFGLAGTRFRPSGGSNINDDVTEVIFDIEVSIYKHGAYDEDFTDSQRMVVIKGSKNN